MSIVLNFSKNDISLLEKALSELERMKVTSGFESMRFRDGENFVVVYTSGKTVIQGKDPEKTKEWLLEKLGLGEALVLGFDEAGRGEGSGPMVVCGVFGDTNALRELRDSKKTKKISEKFSLATKNALGIASFSLSASFIDRLRKKGLTLNEIEAKIIAKATEAFESLGENPKIVVDGDPMQGLAKKTVFLPKADDLEPVVGAASVCAKFLRENSGDKGKRETWKKKSA